MSRKNFDDAITALETDAQACEDAVAGHLELGDTVQAEASRANATSYRAAAERLQATQ